jgi:hypothetical protein
MNQLAAVIAAVVTVSFAACGGNVVVDGNSSGLGGATTQPGAGGAGGAITQPGAGGATCFSISSSTLSQCGASSSGGDCDFDFCDGQGNTFEASCQGIACQCLFNGALMCTCALTSGGDICTGTPNCCFAQ